MKHYQWTELDYVAGAAHMEGMSYGRYVACGMPNLKQFKRRADAGEFDHKPVRARSRKGVLAAVAAQDKPVKRPKHDPGHLIPEGACIDCGAVIPAEYRSGAARKRCTDCTNKRRAEQKRAAAKAYWDRQRGKAKSPDGRLG